MRSSYGDCNTGLCGTDMRGVINGSLTVGAYSSGITVPAMHISISDTSGDCNTQLCGIAAPAVTGECLAEGIAYDDGKTTDWYQTSYTGPEK